MTTGRVSRGMVSKRLANDHGVALVTTLFIIALVTVLVLEFHFDAAVEFDLAANYASDVQAYYLALSGISFARALLLRDDADADGVEDTWSRLSLVPVCIPPQQLLSMAGDEGVTSIFVPGDSETETTERPATPSAGQGCVILQLADEQSKLPINALRPASNTADEQANSTWDEIFKTFFVSFQIEEDVIDALLDWVDANDLPTGIGGAESTYYDGLENPYTPPNRAMRTIGELRLIRGFDNETLAKLFPGRAPETMVDVDLGTNRYLTVYGDEKAKVNVNTATREVLEAIFNALQEGGSTDLVDEIDTRRQEEQFTTIQEVTEFIADAGLQTQLPQVADVKSRFFRVQATGVVDGIRKRAVAIIERDDDETRLHYFKVE